MTFTWQSGGTLPAAQNITVSNGTAVGFTVTVAGGAWLTVTPLSGTTPGALKATANPTSLPPGTYAATITVTPADTTITPVPIAVTLSVTTPASALAVAPTSVSVTYQTGDPVPNPQALTLTSGEGLLAFSVVAAGGTWLSVSPASGVIFLGFPAQVSVIINPTGLAPGAYKGTVTIASTTASNKSQVIAVTLTVNPGLPVITSLWPSAVPVGSPDTTVTIGGTEFYSGSVVKANGTVLKSTLLGTTALTAVIPAPLLSTAGALPIIVSNPPPGGGDSTVANVTVLTPGPHIVAASVVNAASFGGGPVAPGEMVTIFGSGIGPASLVSLTPPASGAPVATTLGGVQVFFDTTPAPLIYVSSGQVTAVAPYEIAGQTTTQVYVAYNGVMSEIVTLNVAAAAPGFFTLGVAGAGQCAALNYDATSQLYTINSTTNPTTAGSTVVLYATGEGQTNPAGVDGIITTGPVASLPVPVLVPSVTIGGIVATVLSATEAPGFIGGMMQLNVQVPTGIKASNAVPVVLTVGKFTSQAGVTIVMK